MGLLSQRLAGHSRVGIDTPVFIYLLEESPEFGGLAFEALKGVERGEYTAVTSVLTLLEISVQPLRSGHPEIARMYETSISRFPNLEIVDIGLKTANHAAALRANYGLATADALQIAACLEAGATAFLTNDLRLRRIEELEVLALADH